MDKGREYGAFEMLQAIPERGDICRGCGTYGYSDPSSRLTKKTITEDNKLETSYNTGAKL